MKTWQVFVFGLIGLAAVLSLPLIEPLVTAIVAVGIFASVIAGFCLQPKREIFFVRTTSYDWQEEDAELFVTHDQIGVRVEVARLWLLFGPTFAAVAFLIVSSVEGTTWHFSLMERFFPGPTLIAVARFVIGLVFVILAAWIGERWLLRDAEACSAGSVSVDRHWLSYMFVDQKGGYYGGYAFRLVATQQPEVDYLVFYRSRNPRRNKIAAAFLLHKFSVVAHAVPEFDAKTVATKATAEESLG